MRKETKVELTLFLVMMLFIMLIVAGYCTAEVFAFGTGLLMIIIGFMGAMVTFGFLFELAK